jgi:CrcB protein
VDDDDASLPIDPDLAPDDVAEPSVGASVREPRPRRRPGRARPDVIAVIALGGMIGSTARYSIARALPTPAGHFPWATFWTNVSGSFLLGFGLILVLERFPPTRYLRPFFATGILGAYTTMSTFIVETTVLIKDDHVATAVLYALGSIAAGLALSYAGIVTGRLTPERRRPAP